MPGQYPEDASLQSRKFTRDTQREACEDIQRWIKEGTLPQSFAAMSERSEEERGDDGFSRRHYSNMFRRFFGPSWGEDTFEYINETYSAETVEEKLELYRNDLEEQRTATGASGNELGIGTEESEDEDLPPGDPTEEELELFRQGFNVSQRIGSLSPRKRAFFIQGFDLGQKTVDKSVEGDGSGVKVGVVQGTHDGQQEVGKYHGDIEQGK